MVYKHVERKENYEIVKTVSEIKLEESLGRDRS